VRVTHVPGGSLHVAGGGALHELGVLREKAGRLGVVLGEPTRWAPAADGHVGHARGVESAPVRPRLPARAHVCHERKRVDDAHHLRLLVGDGVLVAGISRECGDPLLARDAGHVLAVLDAATVDAALGDMMRVEPDLLLRAGALLVALVVSAPDGGESEVEKAMAEHLARGLGHVAVAPEGASDPEPHLALGGGEGEVLVCGHQGDGAHRLVRRPDGDRIRLGHHEDGA